LNPDVMSSTHHLKTAVTLKRIDCGFAKTCCYLSSDIMKIIIYIPADAGPGAQVHCADR